MYRSLNKAMCQFSTLKYKTVDISKFSKQHNGFVLYQHTQQKSIKNLSMIFMGSLLYSAVNYLISPVEYKEHFLTIASLVGFGFLCFGIKNRYTVKQIVLDKRGQAIFFSHYRWFGFRSKTIYIANPTFIGIKPFSRIISVPVLRNKIDDKVHTSIINSRYIVDKEIFDEVTKGNYIKVKDTKK